MRSIDDTSNFDDFPDVEIGLGELGKGKNGKKEKEDPPMEDPPYLPTLSS